MSNASKGTRLYLQPARRNRQGKIIERATYYIRDVGGYKHSTGCGEGELEKAQRKLAEYTLAKQIDAPQPRDRDRSQVTVADVIKFYSERKISKLPRPKEVSRRLERVLDFMGSATLDKVNQTLCEDYAGHRRSDSAARRELEDFRAALALRFLQCSDSGDASTEIRAA